MCLLRGGHFVSALAVWYDHCGVSCWGRIQLVSLRYLVLLLDLCYVYQDLGVGTWIRGWVRVRRLLEWERFF